MKHQQIIWMKRIMNAWTDHWSVARYLWPMCANTQDLTYDLLDTKHNIEHQLSSYMFHQGILQVPPFQHLDTWTLHHIFYNQSGLLYLNMSHWHRDGMLLGLLLGRKLLLDKADMWYSRWLHMSQLSIAQVVICSDSWNHKAKNYQSVYIECYYKLYSWITNECLG